MDYANPVSAKPKEQTTIEGLTARLNQIHAQLSENCSRLQQTLDRAFGSMPENANASTPRAVPSGAVGILSERIEDMDATCERQRMLLSRFESFV